MSKVLMIQHEDGRVLPYKPVPVEWESTGKTEDEFLAALEITYNNNGITTLGIIEESAIPAGGRIDHLIWDGLKLTYDRSAILDERRADFNNKVNAVFVEKEDSVQITIKGVLFNNSERMKMNLGLLAGVVANGGTIPVGATVRQADGTRVNLTTQLHLDLSNALTTAHSDLLNSLEDHFDAIAIADESALDIYDVDAGWPRV